MLLSKEINIPGRRHRVIGRNGYFTPAKLHFSAIIPDDINIEPRFYMEAVGDKGKVLNAGFHSLPFKIIPELIKWFTEIKNEERDYDKVWVLFTFDCICGEYSFTVKSIHHIKLDNYENRLKAIAANFWPSAEYLEEMDGTYSVDNGMLAYKWSAQRVSAREADVLQKFL